MNTEGLIAIAELLRQRNEIDGKITEFIGRPMTSGHLGEWIASEVFTIKLESAANAKGIDGRFEVGPLAGRTVNVKWYLKREVLDMTLSEDLDYYLVLSGPKPRASAGRSRPWRIDAVYLFDARTLAAAQVDRGVRVGVASSIRDAVWAEAEVFPDSRNSALPLNDEQRVALSAFAHVE